MLAFLGDARIFLYHKPMDLRKGFEGLGLVIETLLEKEITSGYFVFLNRRRDRMKVLYWDGDGLVIWYKRLEKGTFSKGIAQETSIGRREFLMLLEGVTPKRFQKRYSREKR